MIRKLYEEHFLEIDALLTKECKRLKLSPNELVILKTLFQMYKKKVFSIAALAKKIELSPDEIGRAIDLLTSKGFISFSLEVRSDKQVEVFDLTGSFEKITALYEADLKEAKETKHQSKISSTIEVLENALGKSLSSLELEIIRSWYENDLYLHETIISKIEEHQDSGRFSVKFLERVLNQTKLKSSPRDEKADQAIDQIFKAIK